MAALKTCTTCGVVWETTDDALNDPLLSIVGYQADVRHPGEGFYLFNHDAGNCGSTLAFPAHRFFHLSDVTAHQTLLFATDPCEGRCLKVDDLLRCGAPCSAAFAREVLAVIVRRKCGFAPAVGEGGE